MKAEYVLELYDSFWFKHSIIRGIKHSSIPPTSLEHQQIKDEPSDLKLLNIPVVAEDFISNNSLKLPESFSPNSVLQSHSSSYHFSTKKDVTEDSNPMMLPKMKRSRKMRKHKSLAELEMEEVEGFMDLGFVFTEKDGRSRLASIVPGLKRMWKEEDEDNETEIIHERPYLSERWDFVEWKKKVEKSLNWRIPEDMSNEVRMKYNLKLWAQSVASLVI